MPTNAAFSFRHAYPTRVPWATYCSTRRSRREIATAHIRTLLILLLALLTASCVRPNEQIKVGNYEILEIPRAPSIYEPGRKWYNKIGPTGERLGQISSDKGPDNILMTSKAKLDLEIKTSLSRWLSNLLGTSLSQEEIHVGGLGFVQMDDIHSIQASGDFIYETITADQIELDLRKHANVNSGIKIGDGFSLTGMSNNTKRYLLRSASNGPLVVGMRIIRLQQQKPIRSSGKIEARRVGVPFKVGLGYTLELAGAPEPSTRDVHIFLRNSEVPYLPDGAITIAPGMPWIGEKRSRLQDGENRIVWDVISLSWSGKIIEFYVDRQSLTTAIVESGL